MYVDCVIHTHVMRDSQTHTHKHTHAHTHTYTHTQTHKHTHTHTQASKRESKREREMILGRMVKYFYADLRMILREGQANLVTKISGCHI